MDRSEEIRRKSYNRYSVTDNKKWLCTRYYSYKNNSCNKPAESVVPESVTNKAVLSEPIEPIESSEPAIPAMDTLKRKAAAPRRRAKASRYDHLQDRYFKMNQKGGGKAILNVVSPVAQAVAQAKAMLRYKRRCRKNKSCKMFGKSIRQGQKPTKTTSKKASRKVSKKASKKSSKITKRHHGRKPRAG